MLKKTYRIRLLLLGFLSLLVFAAIEVRLYYLQVLTHEFYASRANQQQNKSILLTPRRGDIRDRNGEPLATSHSSDTIFIDTRKYETPAPGLVHELAEALHRPEDAISPLFKRLARHKLCAKVPEETSKLVSAIENQFKVPPGVFSYEKHSKREYPNGSLACHILGFTKVDDNGDNIGEAGIELKYDPWLKGSYVKQKVPITSGQRGLAPLADAVIEATYGNNVVLTIDEQIQMFTEQALRHRVGEVQAKGGIAVVMDVKTGEILALASCPDFDLNDFGRATPEQLRNRILTDPIEIGSVMKIVTTTLLLDHGLLNPDEPIDCQGGRGFVAGRRLTDSHHLGVVPFRMAFADSSNIGLATVGLRLEPNTYYKGLLSFGLGQPTGLDLPGEGKGILRPVEQWTPLSRTSLPIGYETSLTAIQVISALGSIGNGGQRMRPHLVKEIVSPKGQVIKSFDPELVDQVSSAETAKTVRELMEGVVLVGTGKEAQIPGFRIGGKTGTTIKTRPGVTPKKYIASFAALMPIQNPRLAVYMYVDEPAGEEFYGGSVAAPIFREIAYHVAHILGIPPDDPVAFEKAQQTAARLEAMAAGVKLTTGTTEVAAGAPPRAANGVTSDTEVTSGSLVAASDAYTGEGGSGKRMPDCRGLTIREAWGVLETAGITAKMMGSGVVVRQEPAAGVPLMPGKPAKIIFALPSEVAKTNGAAEPIRAK